MKPAWLKYKMHPFYRVCLFLTWVYFKIFFRFKVYGHEHYLPGKGILASNHVSFFDPPLAAVAWPEEIHFLARDSLFKNFLFGRLIKALNAHPVHGGPSDATVFKLVLSILSKGNKIILFPEGSRSYNGDIQPFKSGIALLASKSDAPVFPVYIKGAYEAFGRLRKWPRFCGRVSVVFGSPMYFSEFSKLAKKEAHSVFNNNLKERVVRLKEWIDAGARGIPP